MNKGDGRYGERNRPANSLRQKEIAGDIAISAAGSGNYELLFPENLTYPEYVGTANRGRCVGSPLPSFGYLEGYISDRAAWPKPNDGWPRALVVGV
jgi:hypothetical protein